MKDRVAIVFELCPGGFEVWLEGVDENKEPKKLKKHERAALQVFQDFIDLQSLEEADTAVMN